MNIDKMKKHIIKRKKPYISTPKDRCEVILFDFEKPLKQAMFKNTEYVYYKCRFIKINDVRIEDGNHQIQLSFKTAWLQMYNYLYENEIIRDKDIHLWIVKKDNYHYIFNTKHLTQNTKHNDINHKTEKELN